jgi:hypothetical protein
MKRSVFLLVTMAIVIAFAPAALAQFFPPPCNPLPQDRSITFCYPIDDATIAQAQTSATGWIKDSLPHTANEYIDGKLLGSNIPDEFGTAGFGGNYDDKIHTFTIVVTDSQGSFQKSASVRLSLQLPCALPSADPGFVVCTPSDGEVDSRPMRIAAVAHSSTGFSNADTIEVWIDGTKYGVSHEPLGTTNMKILNSFFYIPVGTHKITIFARMPDGTKITKHRTVTVVNYAP